MNKMRHPFTESMWKPQRQRNRGRLCSSWRRTVGEKMEVRNDMKMEEVEMAHPRPTRWKVLSELYVPQF